MAVEVTGTPVSASGNLSSGATLSIIVPTGTTLLCVTWHSSNGTTLTGVTFNTSETLTLVSLTSNVNGEATEIWELANPTDTTANIEIAHSGGMHHSGFKGICFNGSGTASDGDSNDIITTTTSSITVSNVVADDYVLDAIAMSSDPSEGTSQTNFADASSGGNHFSSSYQDGGAGDNGVMSWSFSSDSGSHSACRIPVVGAGPQTVTPDSIPSAETFDNPTIVAGKVNILPTDIISVESFDILKLSLNVEIISIPSAESVENPTIIVGVVNLQVSDISSDEIVENPTVILSDGDQTVSPSEIPSSENFGSLTIIYNIISSEIPSNETVENPTIIIVIFPINIDSVETVENPIILIGTINILPTPVLSLENFDNATIVTGNVNILPTEISSDESVDNPIVSLAGGPQTLLPNSITSAETFGAIVVLGGAAIIAPGGIPSVEVFGSLTIGISIEVNSILSAELVEGPTVSNVNVIVANGISSAENIGNPTVALLNSIQPNVIVSAENFVSDELITDGQDMGDASWPNYAFPTTNEQVASHDGQLLCRHIVTPVGGGILNAPKYTTITGRQYKVIYKLKILSGTQVGAYIRKGDDSGYFVLANGHVAASWTTFTYSYTETAGGSLAYIWFQSTSGEREFYVDEASVRELVPTVLTSNIISPISINSAENVGNPTITLLNTVQPNAIDTVEVVSSPTVNAYATVSPSAITSEEIVAQPKLNLFVDINSIISGEVFGTPNVIGAEQTIITTSITSLEAFSLLTITAVSSKRWLVINNIIQSLRNITQDNGYSNTIRAVINAPLDYDQIDDNQIPFIIVDDTRFSTENLVHMLQEDIEQNLEITLKIVYRANNNLSHNMNKVISDVKKCIYLDFSRGDNADATRINRVYSNKTDKKNTVEILFDIVAQYIYHSTTEI